MNSFTSIVVFSVNVNVLIITAVEIIIWVSIYRLIYIVAESGFIRDSLQNTNKAHNNEFEVWLSDQIMLKNVRVLA